MPDTNTLPQAIRKKIEMGRLKEFNVAVDGLTLVVIAVNQQDAWANFNDARQRSDSLRRSGAKIEQVA